MEKLNSQPKKKHGKLPLLGALAFGAVFGAAAMKMNKGPKTQESTKHGIIRVVPDTTIPEALASQDTLPNTEGLYPWKGDTVFYGTSSKFDSVVSAHFSNNKQEKPGTLIVMDMQHPTRAVRYIPVFNYSGVYIGNRMEKIPPEELPIIRASVSTTAPDSMETNIPETNPDSGTTETSGLTLDSSNRWNGEPVFYSNEEMRAYFYTHPEAGTAPWIQEVDEGGWMVRCTPVLDSTGNPTGKHTESPFTGELPDGDDVVKE